MSAYLMNQLNTKKMLNRNAIFHHFNEHNNLNELNLDYLNEENLQLNSDEKGRLPLLYKIFIKQTKKQPLSESDYDEKNCIFTCNKIVVNNLSILDFATIKFVNCVIYGNIYIEANPKYRRFNQIDIYLENTIIFGQLTINCYSGENTKVTIYQCAIDNLYISGDSFFENFSINYSSLGLIQTQGLINKFSCYYTQIEAFRKKDSTIKTPKFSMVDINWKNSLDLNKKKFQWTNIKHCIIDYHDNERTYEYEEKEKKFNERKLKAETIQFYKNIFENFSLKDTISLQFEEQKIDSTTCSRFFSKLASFLIYPFKTFLLMLVIIIFFSIIFYFSDEKNIGLLNSLRHSVITFTTIGYDDLSQASNTIWTIASIFEGIFGVCSSGAFLIALTRKYLDKKF